MERLERLRSVDESVCPTCGSELTDSHRAQVEGQLKAELDELIERIDTLHEEIEIQGVRRDALRAEYRDLKQEEEAGATVLADLVRLEEQAALLDRLEREKEGLDEQEALVKKQLADDAFAVSLRETLSTIDSKLAELGF